jgi:hypothetical protein
MIRRCLDKRFVVRFLSCFCVGVLASCSSSDDPDKRLPPTGSGASAATTAAQAAADAKLATVQAPPWSVGSYWEWSDGYALQVSAVDRDLTVFSRLDAKGQWFSRRGFLREEAQGLKSFRKTIYRSVPAVSGMRLTATKPLAFTREYLTDGKQRVHTTSWVLEGREKISVPAGIFDCWIVVMRTRSQKTDWTGFERWWYSDEVQNYVRMEYRYGNTPEGSRVLMDFELATPGSKTSSALPAKNMSLAMKSKSLLAAIESQ